MCNSLKIPASQAKSAWRYLGITAAEVGNVVMSETLITHLEV